MHKKYIGGLDDQQFSDLVGSLLEEYTSGGLLTSDAARDQFRNIIIRQYNWEREQMQKAADKREKRRLKRTRES